MMAAENRDSADWMLIWDCQAGAITVVRESPLAHWCWIEPDLLVSDPDGNFVVYRARFDTEDSDSLFPGPPVMVRIALGESDMPKAIHADFNVNLLGTPTLWPVAVGFGGPSYIWNYTAGHLWRGAEPTKWVPAREQLV